MWQLNDSGGMATYQGALETRFGLEYSWSIRNWIPTINQKETNLESHGPFSLAPIILADLTDLPVIQVYRMKIWGN